MQNGVQKAVDGVEKMPEGVIAARWKKIDTRALSAIQLCLSNEVLKKVVKEITTKGIGKN